MAQYPERFDCQTKGQRFESWHSEFSVLIRRSVSPLAYLNGLGVFKSVSGFPHLEEHMKLFEKSRVLSPYQLCIHHFITMNWQGSVMALNN